MGDVCCGDAEVCYVGQCIVPGNPCSAAACATSLQSDCDKGEVCDASLGACVPNFADPTCAFEPEVGVFDPVPRFTWGVRQQRDCALGCQTEEICNAGFCEPTWNHVQVADDDLPDDYQCVMSPMVADLDGDCTPEIIFNSYSGSGYTTNGVLRAISGNDGSKVWTLSDPAYETDPGSTPAIADINGDGIPEVVVPSESNTLIAVQGNDGTVLWVSEPYSGGGKSGSPSIANFDNVGDPEIAFGRNVFDASGILVWNVTSGPTGANGSVGPLSCVADLDGDGRPELITGGTAYTFTGTVGVDFDGAELWTAAQADGYCGIADFDLDGQPEVVNVRSANIYIYDGLTGVTLGSLAIPGGGAGGPPNIADFDGDGFPDVGTAGGNSYVVAQYDIAGGMTQLWEADTKDGSSQRTGSSVFDFDGDGRSEVIYGDEWYLRIYPRHRARLRGRRTTMRRDHDRRGGPVHRHQLLAHTQRVPDRGRRRRRLQSGDHRQHQQRVGPGSHRRRRHRGLRRPPRQLGGHAPHVEPAHLSRDQRGDRRLGPGHRSAQLGDLQQLPSQWPGRPGGPVRPRLGGRRSRHSFAAVPGH